MAIVRHSSLRWKNKRDFITVSIDAGIQYFSRLAQEMVEYRRGNFACKQPKIKLM